MKKFFINNIMSYIKKNSNYNSIKLKEIEYGLISIYLTISKILIIIAFSITLNITKNVMIFMICFNILRTFAFGLHASKSWICLISSTVTFIGIPILSEYITFNIIIKFLILLSGIILIIKNSPADTAKRPIINKKRRLFFKISASVISIIYSILCFVINNNFIINCLIFSIIIENILISPLIYKLFNMPYNNYVNYLKLHPEYSK